MKKKGHSVKKRKRSNLFKPKTSEEFIWTQDMSVDEEKIDNQHRSLLVELNKLIKEASMGDEMDILRETLHFLDEYIAEHFSYEEGYMEKIRYPSIKEHMSQHRLFIKFYTNFKEKFERIYAPKKMERQKLQNLINDARRFLGFWLISHIKISDHKYAEFARKKSESAKTPKISKNFKKIQKNQILNEIKMLKEKNSAQNYVKTDIPGFDRLFEEGIPRGHSILISGGAGSGKTIFCLQTLMNKVKEGKKCFYMSFEESEKRLIEHMERFGWNPREFIKKGNLIIQRINPFDITRSVDAMLAKQKGELLIDVDPVIIPRSFKPDFIALDSLTAIASAFTGKEESYRIYIEQLFRFFERMESTNFLITETEQVPEIFSKTGVEEFLADGVVVLYNFKRGDIREKGIEILKMRGENHQKKIVAFSISDKGIVVYPEQEVFAEGALSNTR